MDVHGDFATKIFNTTWFAVMKRRKPPKFPTDHGLNGTNILMKYYADKLYLL